MTKKLDDIVSDLVYQVFIATNTYDYLDSTCQKHMFAEKRVISLKRKISGYKKRIVYRNGTTSFPDTLSIEMDLDHCILSLQSSLEHLAQLINSVAKLGLKPTVYETTGHEPKVSLINVIKVIDDSPILNNNPNLSELSRFLKEEMKKDWYRELHKLRIENFHHKSRDILNHLSVRIDPKMIEELFLMPQDVLVKPNTKRDREITHFCQKKINDVEDALYVSFHLLSKYLDDSGHPVVK